MMPAYRTGTSRFKPLLRLKPSSGTTAFLWMELWVSRPCLYCAILVDHKTRFLLHLRMLFPHTMRQLSAIFLVLFFAACGNQTVTHSEESALPAASSNSVPATPKVQLIGDFEGDLDDLTNALGGESGEWNMNPLDINDSYTDPLVVEMTGKDGQKSQVLSLAYSVDTPLESQNGYWTKLKGFDASDYDHLEFDVKGDSAKGFTEVFKLEIKKPKPKTQL